jgi:hypothetical protein
MPPMFENLGGLSPVRFVRRRNLFDAVDGISTSGS